MGKLPDAKLCKLCRFPFVAKRFDAVACGSSCRSRLARIAAGKLSWAKARRLARDQRAENARRRVFGKR